MSKVFVGRLDASVTKRKLDDEFGKYGVVKSVQFTGVHRTSAIISFDHEREARRAIRELNGRNRNGWRVEPAQYEWVPRSPPPTHRGSPTYEPYNIPGRNNGRRNRRSRTPPRHRRRSPARAARLHIGNLSPSVTERHLEDEFAVLGAISSVRILRGRPAGHAFIHLINDIERDAGDAIRELNGTHGWIVGPLSRVLL